MATYCKRTLFSCFKTQFWKLLCILFCVVINWFIGKLKNFFSNCVIFFFLSRVKEGFFGKSTHIPSFIAFCLKMDRNEIIIMINSILTCNKFLMIIVLKRFWIRNCFVIKQQTFWFSKTSLVYTSFVFFLLTYTFIYVKAVFAVHFNG